MSDVAKWGLRSGVMSGNISGDLGVEELFGDNATGQCRQCMPRPPWPESCCHLRTHIHKQAHSRVHSRFTHTYILYTYLYLRARMHAPRLLFCIALLFSIRSCPAVKVAVCEYKSLKGTFDRHSSLSNFFPLELMFPILKQAHRLSCHVL